MMDNIRSLKITKPRLERLFRVWAVNIRSGVASRLSSGYAAFILRDIVTGSRLLDALVVQKLTNERYEQ
ncbi:hypothetical protein M378DRAFT_160059 [Amanita muscaria Koide BX008]|uniref:Uncharacterized protein n=1 Tax=Amanita muscaria (strain Koide BX008) TaxID=946122 RepID=A0A0C2WZ47_AMAMK|nr:hypothetical protein M378DRAFT_160059 [Amanita muscaria Koide BX008]